MTNQYGSVEERYSYGPYGEVEIHDSTGALLEASAVGNPFLYTGQRYDPETGFYYYKARYYHPGLGRFLQRDPLGYADGYNLYAYVNNNPINWIDPLGLEKGRSNGLIQTITDYWKQNNAVEEQQFQRQQELGRKILIGQSTGAEKVEYHRLISEYAFEMATGMAGGMKFVGKALQEGAVITSKVLTANRTLLWQYGDLPSGILGSTDKFGNIIIKRGLSGNLFQETLRHERVHSFFSPKPGAFFSDARASLGMWGYNNSSLLRYLEEVFKK